MNSGIGDADELRKHGIDIVHELKGVGKNLQDHYGVLNSFYATQPITLHRSAASWKLEAGIRYLLFGTGDAAIPTSAGAFFKSSPDKDIPDTQLHFTAIQPRFTWQVRHWWKTCFTAVIYICRPQSRGHIALRSSNPSDAPLMYPNYLSEEQDMIDTRNALAKLEEFFIRRHLIPTEANKLNQEKM